jgi:hypothetical protein
VSTTVTKRFLLVNQQDNATALIQAIAPLTVDGHVMLLSPCYIFDSTYSLNINASLFMFHHLPTNDAAILQAVLQNSTGFVTTPKSWGITGVLLS